jgi:glycosyltransferase involved in cell wall biosynthesis
VVSCIDNMQVGGTELNAIRTAERLDRSRFQLSVVCLQETGPLMQRYSAADVEVIPLPISSLYGPRTLRQGMRLARFLRERRVDIFHAHDIYSNIFAVPWARIAGTPVVLASRRWWVGPATRIRRLANRMAYQFAHCVVANCAAVTRLLEAEGVSAEKVAVVPNALPDHAFDPPTPEVVAQLRDRLALPVSAPQIGIIANLTPVKDHTTLLRAVAALAPRWPDLHAVLVGEGPCRPSLESLAVELGIRERVHLVGLQPNEPNLHHLFDVSVLCSLSEGLPNSVLEAMAAGRPVVATRVGGNVDAVVEGSTGVLVPPADPRCLANAIADLLGDPERRRAMGAAALRRARELYDGTAAVNALETVYDRLLSVRKGEK